MRHNIRSRANSAAPFRSVDTVERVETDDGEFLKATGVLAKEGVYQYPRANRDRPYRELLPSESLEASEEAWDHIPLALDHPVDEDGIATTFDAGVEEPPVIGDLRSPTAKDDSETKLTGEAWFDLAHSGEHDGEFDAIVEALENDETIETSAAYRTSRANESGIYNGERYDAVQRPLLPDHVAVFVPGSGKTGNCSVEAGCGIGRANQHYEMLFDGLDDPSSVRADDVDDDTAASIGRRVVDAIGLGGLFDRANGDQQSDESAESDTGDDEGAPPSDPNDSMKDQEKIDYLVEQHGLDRANMKPLEGTNCLGQIYERYEATANADQGDDPGGPTDNDADADADPDGDSDDDGDDGATDPDGGALDQILSRLESLEAKNEELREQLNQPAREKQEAATERLAEEFDVDADAIDIKPDAAESILARANEQTSGYSYEAEQERLARANMAGVAGEVTRSNVDDTEDYVAGVQQGNDRFQSGGD